MKKLPKKVNAEKVLDKWHSLYVRSRDGYVCKIHERANELKIILPFRCAGVMQINHKFSRGKKSIKYHEKNSVCGCSGANTWAHYNTPEWIEICYKLWAEDMQELEVLSKMICKRKNIDKLHLAEYFKQKYESMRK